MGLRISYLTARRAASVSIAADLPGSGTPRSSELRFTERWTRAYLDQPWQLSQYAYELLDYERDTRVALHLHDAAWFIDTYRVVVHEHCERPIGHPTCRHYAGIPVSDSIDAVDRMLEIWTRDPPPDCGASVCLD